jgi:perosamine synthetase
MSFIPISSPDLGKLEETYLLDAYQSGWISSTGPYVERLSEFLPSLTATKYATPVSNGTTALHLALLAVGVKPGDEVIVPNLSFVAVVNAVLYCGAIPVLCDIEEPSLGLRLDLLENLINPRTKAIIVVHNYGFFSDVRPIMNIIGDSGIRLIEDCAEAPFLQVNGTQTGSLADISTYSFFGNKIVTSGEGGCVATNDLQLLESVNYLKNQANLPDKKFVFEDLGFNYRMTNLQAAVLVGQLERIPELMSARYKVLETYRKLLLGINGLTVLGPANLIEMSPWIISISVQPEIRENLMDALRRSGIDSRPFFSPHSRSKRFNGNGTFPVSEKVYEESFNLPTYNKLTTNQIEYICETLSNHISILSK